MKSGFAYVFTLKSNDSGLRHMQKFYTFAPIQHNAVKERKNPGQIQNPIVTRRTF